MFATALLVALVGVACSTANEPEKSSRALLASPSGRTDAFQLKHEPKSRSEVGRHAALLTGVLLGKTQDESEFVGQANSAAGAEGSVHFALPSNPRIKISYEENSDAILVLNEELTGDHESTNDIGSAAAEKVFESTFEGLISNAEISRAWDRTVVVRAQISEAEGVSGQKLTSRTKEYVFSVPRKINGIPVFGSGLTVSVHRGGGLTRLKVFGPQINSSTSGNGVETSMTGTDAVTVSVSQEAADSRIRAQFPRAKVVPVGLQYWLPDGTSRLTWTRVEPRYIYLMAPILPAVQDGANLIGAGSFVAVSSTDATATPTIWPEVGPVVSGTPKP
jgi:hypothetical protein